MRRLASCGLALAATISATASAQESLCNPCVDPGRIRRDDFQQTNSTVTITAEDMRNLGVTSVAEMVAQLPSAGSRVPPISLGDRNAFPVGFAPALVAAANHVRSLEYDPGEFNARYSCPDSICTVDIFPVGLENATPANTAGCEPRFCATMTYSLEEGRVLGVSGWQ